MQFRLRKILNYSLDTHWIAKMVEVRIDTILKITMTSKSWVEVIYLSCCNYASYCKIGIIISVLQFVKEDLC